MQPVLPGNDPPAETSAAICAALHAELDAAVAESAPVAWQTAPGSCYRDPATGESCIDYHRSWQYLLLLGIRNSTHPDTPFLLDTFRSLARRGDRRILISGSADYAMLAHILRAYELEDKTPDVTVIDRCETPLALNRWYAERVRVSIETVQSDAITFVASKPFDIVCAHSFIGWFSPADRDRLVARWVGNLRAGGHVVTTRRLREATFGDGQHAYDAEELKHFEKKVRDAIAQRDSLAADAEEILQATMDDARTRIRFTTTSPEELVALFERNNLEVIVANPSASTAPQGDDLPSGPTRGAGRRVQIVARLGPNT